MSHNMAPRDYKKIEELDKQLKNDPNDLDLLMAKAFVYFQAYDDENAPKMYEKIIKLYPKHIDAYFWLAYYLFRIACREEYSVRTSKKGLKLDPNNAALHAVLAWAIDFGGGDKKEYVPNLKKAIELEPTWITPRISLIENLIEKKELKEAKKEINEASKYTKDSISLSKSDMENEFERIARRHSSTFKGELQDFIKKITNLEIKD